MKRFKVLMLAAMAMLLMAGPAQAQMSAGIVGGASLANIGGDVEGTDMKVGFAGGAFFAIDLHPYFMLQFTGQYVQKGAKETFADVTEKSKVDYLELLVPLTLTIPIEDSPIEPRLFAGPAVGYLMSCKIADVDCKDFTKSVDYGVFFGAGVDYMVGSGAIMLDAWYNLGLANINDDVDSDEFKVKNKTIQIMAGYRFFFGG
jgi:hypothetical protein